MCLYHVSSCSNEAELWCHTWRQRLASSDDARRRIDAEVPVLIRRVQIVRHLSVETSVRIQRRYSDHKSPCCENEVTMKQTVYSVSQKK